MVINESALYKGKLWCAYELKDIFGNYNEELRLKMRKESQNNMFFCPDCKEHLILCAGPIMEPFFKHYDNTNCIMNNPDSRRKNTAARRLLYCLVNESFKDAEIEFNAYIGERDNKINADILVTLADVKIALEYLGHEIKLDEWEKKHLYYKQYEIIDLWFLDYKRYQHKTSTTFEYLMSKYKPVLTFIDYSNNNIILKKREVTEFTRKSYFTIQEFPINEVRITREGILICGKEEIEVTPLNNGYLHMPADVHSQNSNLEGSSVEQEEYPAIDSKAAKADNIIIPKTEELLKAEEIEQVIRRSDDNGNITKYTMKMTSINELWDLPKLAGSDKMIKFAERQRYIYLKNLNKKISEYESENEKMEAVSQAIAIINRRKDAYLWSKI